MLLQNLKKCTKNNLYVQKTLNALTAIRITCIRTPKWLVKVLLILVISAICIKLNTKADKISNPYDGNLKYILLWTPRDWYPFSVWKTGRRTFIEKGCQHTNCYVTDQRSLLPGLIFFDAVAFNGRNLNKSKTPAARSAHQKYIYVNMESSDNSPICDPKYDGFFNWTATYKLNSDIVFSYFDILDKNGEEIGPVINMTWADIEEDEGSDEVNSLKKTKAVAWFVSHCSTRSLRERYALRLLQALKMHNLHLDIYGACSNLKCDAKTMDCDYMLRKNYYFYLSFENSFSDDYVTEKVITALNNSVVPIVYGGADYSRFLPPRSYLDAGGLSPEKLAALIAGFINDPVAYKQFFQWKRYYKIYSSDNKVCRLCAALNNDALLKNSVYKNVRRWWNPNYKRRCYG